MEGEVSSFIGIDIGGTNFKVVIFSETTIENIQSKQKIQITIDNKKYHLYSYSTFKNTEFFDQLQTIKKNLNNFRVGGTGGGVLSVRNAVQDILGQPLKPISEFEAHGKGIEFYKKAELASLVEHFSKNGQQIKITKKQTSLHQYSDILFMSLGSGVNFQLYGESQKGFERKPAKDKALTTGDGYFLEGTCLGAGFLMGLCRMATQQSNFNVLLKKMKEEDHLKCYYETVLVNLFLMALNMSRLHERQALIISGALLSYDVDIRDFFSKAMRYSHSMSSIEITIIRLERLQGFLGALGALQSVIVPS